MSQASDKTFAGAIPALYERQLVPMLFAPFADDLVARLDGRPLARVLELAAGTGAVTRRLAARLPARVAIVATDLNPPMLEQAAALATTRPVEWRQADAQQLPFADASFDAVVCQFGVMFFPDKPRAFAEARRVLRPGGVLLFNVWDRIEANELADTVTHALAALFPEDPPRFMARVPHGYHDHARIARDLAAGGFGAAPAFEAVALRSRAPSARDAALGFCQGTPVRSEIEARAADSLERATAAVEEAIAQRFGRGAIDAPMQACVMTVVRG